MIKAHIGNNLSNSAYFLDDGVTLRQAFDQANINYGIGMNSLDGCTLQPGDLDKTFAEMGIKDECFLLNVAKAVNAATIKVVGGVAVVESVAKLAEIKKLAKYRPDALKLFEGTGKDKECVFAVGAASQGPGSISRFGASFGTATTEDGKATITMMIPEGTADAKKWVMEAVSTAILNLNKVEAQFSGALEETDAELEAISSNIQVL